MLLKFEIENYKSFKDRNVFSMEPAPKQKGLDYSILREKAGDNFYKGLSSAVIYGHNASGKTNLIEAMQVFKLIIQRGNIRNPDQTYSSNPVFNYLELIPNNQLKEKKPVSFSIEFIINHLLVSFSLSVDLGLFLDKTYKRRILEESFSINGNSVYQRKERKISFLQLQSVGEYLLDDAQKIGEVIQSISNNSLSDEELFFTNGFKNIISQKLATMILEYFSDLFQVYYHADNLRFSPIHSNRFGSFPEEFEKAINLFGVHSNKLIYVKDERNPQRSVLYSVMENGKLLPAEVFESYGTIRFVNLFPMIAMTLQKGAVLVVDEFDASIHPMAIMNIINIFHNDEINVNHAQLIFNTHNPLFLNNNILRRDEIKFVERDGETECSRNYSLSDFGTRGSTARKGKDYMKNYFIGKYGAIRDLDFTDVFKSIVEESNGAKNNQ